MNFNNIFKKLMEENEVLVGGMADDMTLEDIANKHNVPICHIEDQFEKGLKVEMEHTTDEKVAGEIARDHLSEDPDYYDKLEVMEKK